MILDLVALLMMSHQNTPVNCNARIIINVMYFLTDILVPFGARWIFGYPIELMKFILFHYFIHNFCTTINNMPTIVGVKEKNLDRMTLQIIFIHKKI